MWGCGGLQGMDDLWFDPGGRMPSGISLSLWLTLFLSQCPFSSPLVPSPSLWDWCLLLSQGAITSVPLHAFHVSGHTPLSADRWHDQSAMGRKLALGLLSCVPRRRTILAPRCWFTTWRPTGPAGASRNGLPPECAPRDGTSRGSSPPGPTPTLPSSGTTI